VTDLLAAIFLACNDGKIDTLASFNRRRRMKAESRQIPQKLAARLNFLLWSTCCLLELRLCGGTWE